MKTSKASALSLLEVLAILLVVLILAGIVFPPCLSCIQLKGAQTKAVTNAHQIATAVKLYAQDHKGAFPSYQLVGGAPANPPVPVTSSNDALCQLIPEYVPSEDIFWVAKSGWCASKPQGPDDILDSPMLSPSIKTLSSGENEWAYVLQLSASSNPALPLLADGWIPGGDQGSHTYTSDQKQKGGVWKGKTAVVVRADTSATLLRVDQRTMNVQGKNGGTVRGDLFSTANGSHGWLKTNNVAVNPK